MAFKAFQLPAPRRLLLIWQSVIDVKYPGIMGIMKYVFNIFLRWAISQQKV